MKYGSLCSGIEAATVAWHTLAWNPAWFSEISSFPSALLATHYPDVANLGDMTKLTGMIERREIEAPDIVCGGTPCQAFSISGNRKSLDDDRGNLSLIFCEVCNAVDDVRRDRGEQPAIILWENVPGVLSTHDNAFGCFLAELAGESKPISAPDGKWPTAGIIIGTRRSVAWRVLDAQYFGLAQRRKRVFVVASARADIDIGQILFEFDGVQRINKPRRETRQSNTGTAAVGIDADSGKPTIANELSHTLKTTTNESVFTYDHHTNNATVNNNLSHILTTGKTDILFIGTEDVAPTLRANAKQSLMSGSGDINSPLAISIQGNIIDRNHGGAQGAGISTEDISYTLTATDRHAVAFKVRGQGHYTGEKNGDISKLGQAGGSGLIMYNEKTFTIAASQDQYVLWQALRYDGGRVASDQDTVPTLTSYMSTGGNNVPLVNVRRLTPRECERLQGFPDDYTLILYKDKDASDAVRYHALGNSWAVLVIRWIGERIDNITKQN
jgi:DNA (cytosine-5)-methyltransferase 1